MISSFQNHKGLKTDNIEQHWILFLKIKHSSLKIKVEIKIANQLEIELL